MNYNVIFIIGLVLVFTGNTAHTGTTSPTPKIETITDTDAPKTRKSNRKTRKLCPNGLTWDARAKSCTETDREM